VWQDEHGVIGGNPIRRDIADRDTGRSTPIPAMLTRTEGAASKGMCGSLGPEEPRGASGIVSSERIEWSRRSKQPVNLSEAPMELASRVVVVAIPGFQCIPTNLLRHSGGSRDES
jgi:hypothetical protein